MAADANTEGHKVIIWNDIALIADDTHFTKWVQESGRLDHHQSLLARALPHVRGTVLDIGANIGTHTVAYAKHAERVLAFEPLPEAFECLEHNVRSLENVELYQCAVGRNGGTTGICTPEKNYGASFTIGAGDIEVISIDSLELPACNFIKLDAEGDEIEILVGAQKTIERFQPTMLIECNRSTLHRKGLTSDELLDCIEQLGYRIEGYNNEICCDIFCQPSR